MAFAVVRRSASVKFCSARGPARASFAASTANRPVQDRALPHGWPLFERYCRDWQLPPSSTTNMSLPDFASCYARIPDLWPRGHGVFPLSSRRAGAGNAGRLRGTRRNIRAHGRSLRPSGNEFRRERFGTSPSAGGIGSPRCNTGPMRPASLGLFRCGLSPPLVVFRALRPNRSSLA